MALRSLLIQSLGGNAFEAGPPSTLKAEQVNGNIDYLFSTKDRLAGPANGCQWLGTIPAVGSLTSPIADGMKIPTQAAPFGSGVIQGTLGSPRLIQMALHLTF